MGGLRETVVAVYVADAELRCEDGKLGVKNSGLLDSETLGAIKTHKDDLIEMLTGDPLHGPGWEGRVSLWRQAMRWLHSQISDIEPEDTEAEERAHQAITAPQEVARLNAAWIDGTFEEFREVLTEHVRVGLRAGRKEAQWRIANSMDEATSYETNNA